MKTGGTSFADLLRVNFPDGARYPDAVLPPDAELGRRMEAYTHVPKLVEDVNRLAEQLQLVRGHVPYSVRSLLDRHYETLTLLRDPVERTFSYLKHCRKYHVEHKDMVIEEIYEDRWFFETFIANYQTKIFSMSAIEALAETRLGDMSPPIPPRAAFTAEGPIPPEALEMHGKNWGRLSLEVFAPATGVIKVDEDRLATAKKNLSDVDLVGVTEGYPDFVNALHTRYGWQVPDLPRKNVSDSLDLTPGLRRRIESDNAFDMELYEFARTLAV